MIKNQMNKTQWVISLDNQSLIVRDTNLTKTPPNRMEWAQRRGRGRACRGLAVLGSWRPRISRLESRLRIHLCYWRRRRLRVHRHCRRWAEPMSWSKFVAADNGARWVWSIPLFSTPFYLSLSLSQTPTCSLPFFAGPNSPHTQGGRGWPARRVG